MTFCSSCGASRDGESCPKCGTRAEPRDGFEENLIATLCYGSPPLAIAMLLATPFNRNPVIRFHAYQAGCFHLSLIAVLLAAMVLWMEGFEPPSQVYWLIAIFFWAVWVSLLRRTIRGKKIELPVIGALAEKRA